ncbi:unnamed protein product, partial [Closterium sp. NIES-53]
YIEELTEEKFTLQRQLDAARMVAESLAKENSALTDDFNRQAKGLEQMREEISKLKAEVKAQKAVSKEAAHHESLAAIERSQALAAEVVALEGRVLRLLTLRSNLLYFHNPLPSPSSSPLLPPNPRLQVVMESKAVSKEAAHHKSRAAIERSRAPLSPEVVPTPVHIPPTPILLRWRWSGDGVTSSEQGSSPPRVAGSHRAIAGAGSRGGGRCRQLWLFYPPTPFLPRTSSLQVVMESQAVSKEAAHHESLAAIERSQALAAEVVALEERSQLNSRGGGAGGAGAAVKVERAEAGATGGGVSGRGGGTA